MAIDACQHNRLLQALSLSDEKLIAPHLQRVPLPVRHRLEEANAIIKHVYFIETGVASVVALGKGRVHQAEAALIGKEGMSGVAVLHGSRRAACDIFMQIEGETQRIEAGKLRELMSQSPSLAATLYFYAHVFCMQVAQAALASSCGTINERLARWLLMAGDRVRGGEELSLTHELLGLMLGVRRPGITVAIGELKAMGALSTGRGSIVIHDRKKLEKAANGLYGVPEAEFERLLS